MRKIALQMYVTLDGVMEAPQNWSFDFWGDALETYAFQPAARSRRAAPRARPTRSSWRRGRPASTTPSPTG